MDSIDALSRSRCRERRLNNVSQTIRKLLPIKAQNALRKQKNKEYGEKRFSIWRMEFLHHAMWHDHDIDFTR